MDCQRDHPRKAWTYIHMDKKKDKRQFSQETGQIYTHIFFLGRQLTQKTQQSSLQQLLKHLRHWENTHTQIQNHQVYINIPPKTIAHMKTLNWAQKTAGNAPAALTHCSEVRFGSAPLSYNHKHSDVSNTSENVLFMHKNIKNKISVWQLWSYWKVFPVFVSQ